MKSVYVVTKPIQLLNSLNIKDDNNKTIYVTPFANRYSFVENARKAYPTIKFVEHKSKTICILTILLKQYNIVRVYLDSDFGLLVRFMLFFLVIPKYYIFEEGYASYSHLRYPSNMKDKVFLFIQKYLRIKNYIGSGIHCGGLYLYDKPYYKTMLPESSIKLLDFEMDYLSYIKQSPLLSIYNEKVEMQMFEHRNVIIYLTSWDVDNRINQILQKTIYKDYLKVLKPHPHIMENSLYTSIVHDVLLSPEVIFEYFLINILDKANMVIVYHHGSFALHYFNNKYEKLKTIVI